MPPAMQKPLTAQMMGLKTSENWRFVVSSKPSASPPVSIGAASLRSRPDEKALSPAAVKIATQPSGSALNSAKASSMPRSISTVSEFIASGRLMVMIATWSRFS